MGRRARPELIRSALPSCEIQAFVFALILVSWIAAAAPAPADGRRLLLDCEKSFLKIETIRGSTKTHSTAYPNGQTDPIVEDAVTDFWYHRFHDIRFENTRPLTHTVISDGKMLWIWSPLENALVEEPLESAAIAARTLLSLHPGFGIDHLAPIPLDDFRATVKPKDGTSDVVVTLTPLANETLRATLQIVVDPDRHFVRQILSLVKEGGTVISDVRFSDEVAVKPGVWFAKRVVTKELLPDGSTIEQVKVYERLKFDTPIDPKKFAFEAPEGSRRVRVVDVEASKKSGSMPETK